MNYQKILLLLLVICSCRKSFSQTGPDLVGTWKGTSLCQVKNSPCHDEIAVYHVVKTESPLLFRFVMNKMVNGKEEDMGITDFTYDPKTQTFTSIDSVHNARWDFTVKEKQMKGTLYYKNNLYRLIDIKKED